VVAVPHENGNTSRFSCLPRTRSERPRDRRTTEQRDEFAPSHSIQSQDRQALGLTVPQTLLVAADEVFAARTPKRTSHCASA